MTKEEMTDELEQFYEAAGFANYYERILKDKTEEQIKQMYENHIRNMEELEEEYYKEREEYLKNRENN